MKMCFYLRKSGVKGLPKNQYLIEDEQIQNIILKYVYFVICFQYSGFFCLDVPTG